MLSDKSEQDGGRGNEIKWSSTEILLIEKWVDISNTLDVGRKRKTQL